MTNSPALSKQALILTLLVLMISGNPVALAAQPEVVLLGVLFILVTYATIRQARVPTFTDIVVAFCFTLLTAYHAIVFPKALMSELGFLVKLLVAFFFTRAVRDPSHCLIEAIVRLAAISLFFYLPQQALLLIGIDIRDLLAPYSLMGPDVVHIGIHNFHNAEEIHRNSGLFWEPGAFAGVILIGLGFLGAKRSLYSREDYRKRLALLIGALLTTQSTTGYLLAPIALALQIGESSAFLSSRRFIKALTGLVLVLPLLTWSWTTLPFLKPKVSSQVMVSEDRGHGWELTRYGNILYDLSFIERRPLFGWGSNPASRGEMDPSAADLAEGQGNGLSGFTVKFGMLGLLLFVGAAYRSFNRLFASGWKAALGLALILLLLNGEQFLNFPLFLSLMFVPAAPRSGAKASLLPIRLSHHDGYGPFIDGVRPVS